MRNNNKQQANCPIRPLSLHITAAQAMRLVPLFMQSSIKQIINGVKEAQGEAKNAGAIISPDSHLDYDSKKHLFCAGRLVEHVEFDVAVTTSKGKETKGGLGIFVAGFGVGTQGKSDASNISVSRIKFSTSVVLPIQS